jgi:excisionase family DNA binding protein
MERLLTIDDVCEITGLRPSTIYAMISRGRIPAVKISGRCVRFREKDIERWLEEKTVGVGPAKAPQPRKAQERKKRRNRRRNGPANSFIDDIVEAAKREVLPGNML